MACNTCASFPQSKQISDDSLKLILEGQKNLADSINKSINDLNVQVSSMSGDIVIIKNDVDQVKTDVTDIERRVAAIETNFCFKDKAEFINCVNANYDLKFMESQADLYQIEIRKKRIMISKIPAGTADDKAFVKCLAEELGTPFDMDKIRWVRRIDRKRSPGNYMLNIEFKYECDKWTFIDGSLSKKLKSLAPEHKHFGIICFQDRSAKQIALFNKLKVEAEKKNEVLVTNGITDYTFKVINYQIVKRQTPAPSASPTV